MPRAAVGGAIVLFAIALAFAVSESNTDEDVAQVEEEQAVVEEGQDERLNETEEEARAAKRLAAKVARLAAKKLEQAVCAFIPGKPDIKLTLGRCVSYLRGKRGIPGVPGESGIGTPGSPGARGDTGRPGADGEDGTDGTDGADGRPPTPEEILAAVGIYCEPRGECRGPQGPDGPPPTNEQVREVLVAFLESLEGRDVMGELINELGCTAPPPDHVVTCPTSG